MSGIAYVDSSALAKLILAEAESRAFLRWWMEADRVAISRIGVVETARAAARHPHDPKDRERVFRQVEVIEVTVPVARAAQHLSPPLLTTLDAIHLASALALGSDLEAFVTYDDRLAAAARQLGLPVVRPA